MKFSTGLILAASAQATLGAYANVTSTATALQTTVVTITSCSDNKCTEVPVTTGVTTITDELTVYTTYCPLTSETTAAAESSAPAPVVPVSSAPAPVESTTEAPTTVAPTTAAPESSAPVVAESSSANSTVAAEVTSFEGAGNKLSVGIAGLAVIAALY
ncbi:covalently-linked cell wall protein 12 [[Candida] jaroonii]|uniref:Covalently-linked cell wall protein 12 n=1 Tax=[Candida] jaroonii TaxID=467808 RepID=A0ACA9YFH4_9ASCO|nr:covalently-linked cell wall protein 12 [[Candida] jaroonii]